MSKRLLVALCLLSACNVTPVTTTGGVDLPARGDCPRGIAVVSSDFQSSEIALLTPAGVVKSSAFLSSGASGASNLAAPFSGDISVASAGSRPGELVVIDRFGTNVLTFVDTRTAVVRAQLPIGTGFEANPQDYLELDEHHAFVPRLGENRSPGREPFDAGSDLLVVDPSVPRVTASLPMPRKQGYWPSPDAVSLLGDDLLVTLQHTRPDFSGMAEGELVAFDRDTLKQRFRLPLVGLKNCGRAELSPNRALLAIACWSYIDRRGASPEPETSGLILFDALSDPPTELRRFAALELAGKPIQPSVEFVSDRVLLFKTQTAQGVTEDNQLFALNLESGEATLLATAARDESGLGYGIAFGDMSCNAGCGDPCLVADASRGKLLRFLAKSDELIAEPDVSIGGAGLPPTALAPFF
jgi:hypothetical protein